MKITFPKDFLFGTSTAAYQIETAFEHDWTGVKSRDGHIFGRTTDHEKRHQEDIEIISSLAPNYRMSLMWSKLQRGPYAAFNQDTVRYYHSLLKDLRSRDVQIMMVLHHFANPQWFSKMGGLEKEENIPMWCDYAKKVVDEFGQYVYNWNTFNEPNLYTSLGWLAAEFPPYKKNLWAAQKVIKNIAAAHEELYRYIKERYPTTQIGISHNCTVFKAHNFTGHLPAAFFDWCFMEYVPGLFKNLDFFGISYYARIAFDPFPITYLNTPLKIKALSKQHDDIWEYYPAGLGESIRRYWKKYKLPIIITENGICTTDDKKRVSALQDYMKEIKQCMEEGINIQGYYHWSTWDNFEWSLGPSYKFGLYECDVHTKERWKKISADIFSTLAHKKEIDV
jgi:beta-glucosidase